MNLYTLAKLILVIENDPISKVRFAKTIYFVHKELIQLGIATTDNLLYVRMPLGPVPFGFMNITTNHPDILSEIVPSGLSYNSVVYSVAKKRLGPKQKKNSLYRSIETILSGLRTVRTSELVEISHQEPSWINNVNGQAFYISKNDLALPVPTHGSGGRLDTDDQLIQASLVRGMIDDIVNESTDLEFPENDKF